MKRILGIFLLVANVSLAQNMDTVKIHPVKVKDHVYMLKGSGGNIGLLTGPEGNLVIDDQFAPLSEKIKAAIATLDNNPIRFLINTHIHGDHTGGNENFQKLGVTILAQEQVRARMTKEQFNARFNRTTPPRDKAAWPVITFDQSIRLHLNGEDIEVIHYAEPGHTDGDAIIHFVNANVFHTGDAFVRYGYPFIDQSSGGSVKGFLAVLDHLLSKLNDESLVIPGHGEVATKADVKKFRDRVADIYSRVSVAIKSGKKPSEVPAMGITDPYDAEWGQGFLKGKDFALMIAEELAPQK